MFFLVTQNEEIDVNKKLFESDPRDYALTMVEDGLVSADHLLLCALKYMSHDDVRDMLDYNELSPRFDEDEPEEDEEAEPEEDEEEDPSEEDDGDGHWGCDGKLEPPVGE
jgi:hypothetical protein